MTRDEKYEWKVISYPSDEKLNETILLSEVDGWKVHHIDLSEYKILLQKPKSEMING
jgi:hypothetical protein